MQEEKFDYKAAVEDLMSRYPSNKFYLSLHNQICERGWLSQKQIACVRENYEKKINNNADKPHPQSSGTRKCSICNTEIRSMFEGTETTAYGLICLSCFDKKRIEEARKERKDWWQNADKILEQPKPSAIANIYANTYANTSEKRYFIER